MTKKVAKKKPPRNSSPNAPMNALAVAKHCGAALVVQRDPDGSDRDMSRQGVWEQVWESVTRGINPHFEKLERTVQLRDADPRFRKQLVDAIFNSVMVHRFVQSNPHGEPRKDMLRLSKLATEVLTGLRKLRSALDEIARRPPPLNREPYILFISELSEQINYFGEKASLFSHSAEMIKAIDKGGAPKMVAFRVLVVRLADAFTTATGRAAKVTWSAHDEVYRGDFLALVEAVLKQVLRMEIGAKRLRYPSSPLAMGQFIHKLTRTRAAKRKHTHPNV